MDDLEKKRALWMKDPEVQRTLAALRRAAKRAHLIAHQKGTGVVISRDGKVVEIEPDPAMYEEFENEAGRATVAFEVELVEECRRLTGLKTKTDMFREGLKLLIERENGKVK